MDAHGDGEGLVGCMLNRERRHKGWGVARGVYNYLNTKYRAFAAFAWTMATYRMIETTQVLAGIILVSATDTGHDEMELRG